MKTTKLLFIDPQNVRHFVTLIRRDPTPGFYEVETEQGKRLFLHHDQILAHLDPAALDQMLDGDRVPIRHLSAAKLAAIDVAIAESMDALEHSCWIEWRNDAPALGRAIEVQGVTKAPRIEKLHSRLEIVHLKDQGYTSWRYI